jgi:DeoR/GlpR family transcriptional regulator of sugar metabolism
MPLTWSVSERLAVVSTGAEVKPKQRQNGILDVVARDGEATVEALAAAFAVSAETIRRDLAQLAQSGVLQKVHGGARRLRLHAEGSFEERLSEDASAKAIIAAKLARIVQPGDTLFMDTGTTTLFCARELATVSGLTVITNSIRISDVLARGSGGASVFVLGGWFNADNGETLGPMALEQVARFRADHAVLSVAALDAQGAMDADFDEAQIARAMAANATNVITVAQAAKLGRKAAYRVCALDEIDVLVCDIAPGDAFGAALDAAGVVLG